MSVPMDLCAIPAGVPPLGHIPDFDSQAPLSVATLTVGAVFAAISTLFVAGRLYHNHKNLKLADYFTIVGYILSMGYSGVIMSMHNFARHQYDVPACKYADDYLWKLIFGQNMQLGIAQFFVKVAILLVYFQLFAINQKMRWIIYTGIAFCAVIYLPHTVVVIALTTPRAGETWASMATNGRPQKMSFYAPFHGFGSIFMDSFILILPMVIVRNLRMPLKKRIGLMVVFAVGALGVVAAIFACYWRVVIKISDAATGDFQWMQSQLFIWIIIEHDAAIIAGCMPACAAFLKKHVANSSLLASFRTKLGRSRAGSKGYSSQGFSSKGTKGFSTKGSGVSEVSLRGLESDTGGGAFNGGRPSYRGYEEMDDHVAIPLETIPGKIVRTTETLQVSSPGPVLPQSTYHARK